MESINNITQEKFEKIESYLDGSMPAEARVLFEKELSENPGLKQQAEDIRWLLTNVEASALLEKLDEFHKEIPDVEEKPAVSKKETKTISIKKFIYWTATAAVFVFGFFWAVQNSSTPEKLFAKHFTPDPGLPTTMSSVTEYNFYEGMVDYKQKNYQTALEKWEPILKEKPENDTLNYFIGVTHLVLGDAQKALEYMDYPLESENSIFKEDAVYYKALALLKNDEKTKALALLEQYPSERNNTLISDLKK